jgi:hypothetical protein
VEGVFLLFSLNLCKKNYTLFQEICQALFVVLEKIFDSFYEELSNLVFSVENPYLSSAWREGLDASSTSENIW